MRISETNLPEKVSRDAILESLFEVRFETDVVQEIFFGKIIENWGDAIQQRIGFEMPLPFRMMDPNMRFAPMIELKEHQGGGALRFGPQILGFHQAAPYPGWRTFKTAIEKAVRTLFMATSDKLTISRLGMRYINALTPVGHRIPSIADLDFNLTIAGDAAPSKLNINFTHEIDARTASTVRIATKDFVESSALPIDTSVIVDIDVFSPTETSFVNLEDALKWVDRAHTTEKVEFFRLFKKPHVDAWKI